ncbi:MAG: flagellar hook protein FlgE [Methylophilaceae bacterium]|uniref:flagellar hook protein FlgE n=1 Tax=Methylovorus sp. MM2 TaxID=1848038 RepID=UPI0007DF64CF|nr:flagellar hook protein FlgE [Methylovorus sp. MM2]OAM51274.1 flagellar hook protein FlgE [Methylovorus sp. MM2]
MAFQQGLSGLNAASKSLDVIGNNVANSSTVGFKQARAEFADVYATALAGTGGSNIGIGTKVATVQQLFTQGNITTTSNPLDIAITGDGFFRVSTDGAITYTRNGQFQLDKTGYIVNSAGAQLTGYMADTSGNLLTGTPAAIQINTADLQPQATTGITAVVNLDSREAAIATAFDANDPDTYNKVIPTTIYDSQGNDHTLMSYFTKTGDNTWDVRTTVDGGTTPVAGPTTITFSSAGIISGTPTQAINFTPAGGSAAMTVSLNLAGSTQFGSDFGINAQSQDGYASGKLASFGTASDGTIIGRYTNGQAKTLGQVVLAKFANPNGLQNLGNNQWAETPDSGLAVVGTAGTGGLGILQSSALEESNVDLTSELVNMITAQRFYQANAQTIKTQDQVLQTLVNLR